MIGLPNEVNRIRGPFVVSFGPMHDAPPAIVRARFFYPAPHYRRLVVILVCGLIGVPTIVIVVRHQLLGAPVQLNVRASVFVGASCAVLLWLLRARIRVDADGIGSRGFIGWRRCPWCDIVSRRAQTLCVGGGPWAGAPPQIQHAYAQLRWLKDEDAFEVYEMLTPAGTCTHLPQLPSRFRMQIFDLRWLEIDTKGLRLEDDGSVQLWYWNDVRKVKIRKETDTSCGVDSMSIELSDGTKILAVNRTSRKIDCECPCQCRHDYLLQQFLRSMLPADKVLVYAKTGPPMSMAEAKHRRASTESGLRLGRNMAVCYAFTLGTLLVLGLAVGIRDCLDVAITLICYGVVYGPIARRERSKRDLLQAYLNARIGPDAQSNI